MLFCCHPVPFTIPEAHWFNQSKEEAIVKETKASSARKVTSKFSVNRLTICYLFRHTSMLQTRQRAVVETAIIWQKAMVKSGLYMALIECRTIEPVVMASV